MFIVQWEEIEGIAKYQSQVTTYDLKTNNTYQTVYQKKIEKAESQLQSYPRAPISNVTYRRSPQDRIRIFAKATINHKHVLDFVKKRREAMQYK